MIAGHEAEVARQFDAQRGRFKQTVGCEDFRLRAIETALGPLVGKRILDLGCGKGRFARHLQARGAQVVGLDLSWGMLAEAEGVPRVRASALRLPFTCASIDAVIAIEVFEHMSSRITKLACREALRVLRKGGLLAIIDKNIAALDARRPWLPSAFVKRLDEYRGRGMYPAGGKVRERWFWPQRLQAELAADFVDVRVFRLLAPSEERTWLFRRLPATRLMTLWLAHAPGGGHA
jgi:2-polyprenyl-6-hydroxyphenyl methylase/3-demethylubiquinone-9 3-methyltransferase